VHCDVSVHCHFRRIDWGTTFHHRAGHPLVVLGLRGAQTRENRHVEQQPPKVVSFERPAVAPVSKMLDSRVGLTGDPSKKPRSADATLLAPSVTNLKTASPFALDDDFAVQRAQFDLSNVTTGRINLLRDQGRAPRASARSARQKIAASVDANRCRCGIEVLLKHTKHMLRVGVSTFLGDTVL